MEICPKCHQNMTWYMTYKCGNPHTGWHCNNCGYDTMSNSHGVTTSKTIWINKQEPPVITRVCDISTDSINKIADVIADAVVQKLMERGE